MTSALHAEGREFNPRSEQSFWKKSSCGLMDKALPSGGRDCGFESRLGLRFLDNARAGMAKWQGNRFVSGRSGVRSPLPAFFFRYQKIKKG